MNICIDTNEIGTNEIGTNESIETTNITFRKMKFINNALEDGWTISKKEDKYIFNKKHEGKKEIYLDSYLQKFIIENMSDRK
jgi:hypothetical protein